jgi:hypothetical protein
MEVVLKDCVAILSLRIKVSARAKDWGLFISELIADKTKAILREKEIKTGKVVN